MSTSAHRLKARCLCGSVRFSAEIEGNDVGACHCKMCRRWSAGPFLYVECGETVQFEASSDLGIYRSSKWAERGFCKQCGSSLYYRMLSSGHHSISAEAFDQPNLIFTTQIFIDQKPPYYSFENDTYNTDEKDWFKWLHSNEQEP
jgi:hypothetical protein